MLISDGITRIETLKKLINTVCFGNKICDLYIRALFSSTNTGAMQFSLDSSLYFQLHILYESGQI